MSWIYLSKKGTDEYINMLANGAGLPPTVLETWRYEDDPAAGLFIRGIMKHKIIKQCWADKRPFFYIDTGYFGNRIGPRNPGGWKLYHRIVYNDLQHGDMLTRPADRWEQLGIPLKPWRRTGRRILIAAPDDKPCVFYGTTAQAWLEHIVSTLRQHTDRDIVIRQRQGNVYVRTRNPGTNFESALQDDIFAVVCFNSSAAIEAVINGIPAFVTAPCHAARPVALDDICKIETPFYADMDLRRAWVSHLAWGQFHIKEMSSGRAQRMLEDTKTIMDSL